MPRLRSIELATGRQGIDVRHQGFAVLSDQGRVIVTGGDTAYDYDATSGSPRTLDLDDEGCQFRGSHDLVCWHNGSIVVRQLP